MGTVYEATQLSLDRKVALKVLAPNLSNDAAFRRRFRREGHAQAALDHDHIVTVYEAGETDDRLFLSMQLVRGCNLKDLIVSEQLDPWRTLHLLAPIANALDMAHASGLIHRDVKPQNILIDCSDHSYLADFGLMRTRTEATLTEPGHFIGTCDYVSPEQICGERVTTKSDLYALAAVLYECLAGVAPYPKDSEVAVLYAHVHETPPRITEVRPELPVALDEVLDRGMAKAPEERQPSARELLSEVECAFAGGTGSASAAKTVHRPASAGPAAPTISLGVSRVERRMPGPRLAVLAATGLLIVSATGFLAGRAVFEEAPTARSVGPDRDYARAMKQTIGALDTARRAKRRQLAAARTPVGQARVASALAGSYRVAGRSARTLTSDPGVQPVNATIAGALARTASGYATMASGARQGSRRRFEAGRNAVRRSEGTLRRALEHLRLTLRSTEG
jgi:Protein kinase domain